MLKHFEHFTSTSNANEEAMGAAMVIPIAAGVGYALFGKRGGGGGGGGGGGEAPVNTHSDLQHKQEIARLERERAEAQEREARERKEMEARISVMDARTRQFETEARNQRERCKALQEEIQKGNLTKDELQARVVNLENSRLHAEKTAAKHAQDVAQARDEIKALQMKLESALEEQEKIKLEKEKKEKEQEQRRAEEMKRMSAIGMVETEYNFAFAGETGKGKTTLVNCIRGKRPYDKAAGKTAEGRDCTLELTKYPLDGFPVAAFDLPGAFTPQHPAETYCRDHCLDLFDCIVVCFNTRFTEIDIHIIQYAVAHKVPIIAVYTKTEFSVKNVQRNCPEPRTTAEALLMLRTDTLSRAHEQLKVSGVDPTPIPFVFVEAFSLLEGNTQFEEQEFFRQLTMCIAARHPDDIKPDTLWNQILQRISENHK